MVNSFFKLIGLTTVMAVIFLFSPINSVKASAAENLRGWAYNNMYGYISFNCLDDGFAGHFTFTFTFSFNVPPCSLNQHGVNLDNNNNFSGDAWNSVLGFITFTTASTTPDGGAFRTNCELSSSTSTACYKESDGKVYGYMRVNTTGEWIKLDDSALQPTTQITDYNSPAPGIFSGYASSSFGSISFNCTNDGTCGSNPYEVKIGPLEIRQLTAPNWGSTLACLNGANQAVLKWNRRSGVQSAYQVIISTQNSTSTGVIFNSGQVISSASQIHYSPLSYDTPYYWFLRLWDNAGSSTPWRQFNTSGTKDWITDNYARNLQKNLVDPNKTFTTYKHEFPRPSFTWSPEEIVIATTSNSFISDSYYYNDANVLQPCNGSVCSYVWSASDPFATVLTPTSASTSIMFATATNTVVTLTSTDDAVYTCSTSTSLNVNYALPLWKEIKAP